MGIGGAILKSVFSGRGLGSLAMIGVAQGGAYALRNAAENTSSPGMATALGLGASALSLAGHYGAARNVALGAEARLGRSVGSRLSAGGTKYAGAYAGTIGRLRDTATMSSFNSTVRAGTAGRALGGMVMGQVAEVAKFPYSAAHGAVGYLAGAPKLFSGNPGAYMAHVTGLKHELAPVAAAALGIGAYGAYAARQLPHRGTVTPPSFMPSSISSQAPVNFQNFGGGISFGTSAISSPTVMAGQGAVVNRMVKRRRV